MSQLSVIPGHSPNVTQLHLSGIPAWLLV